MQPDKSNFHSNYLDLLTVLYHQCVPNITTAKTENEAVRVFKIFSREKIKADVTRTRTCKQRAFPKD